MNEPNWSAQNVRYREVQSQMNDPQMTAARVKQTEDRIREHLSSAITSMQLRKWAMEQALATIASQKQFDLIDLATAIYDFVTQDAKVTPPTS